MKAHVIILMLLIQSLGISLFANSDPESETAGKKPKGVLTGFVVEQSTGTYMEYVHVVLYNEQDSSLVSGVITNDKGKFNIEEIPEGNYYLKVQFIGYRSHFIKNIKITREKTIYNIGDIELKTGENELEEVQVVADKRHVEYKIDKKIINPTQDIVASGGTAVQVLENTPSVQVDIEGNVSLRGSSNYKVLIDGKESLMNSSDALKSVPASGIERIELITNPSANQEADGVAGIINIILKKNSKLGLNGVVDLSANNRGSLNSNIQLSYKPNKVNYHFKLRPSNRSFDYYRKYERYSMPEEELMFESLMDYESNYKEFYTMLGADIDLNEKNSVSLSAGNAWVNLAMQNIEKETNYQSDPSGSRVSTIHQGQQPIRPEINLLFDHIFDSAQHKFTFMAHYSSWDGNHYRHLSSYTTAPDFNTGELDADTSIYTDDINVNHYFKLRADYTKPLSNSMMFETGLQWTHSLRIAEYDVRTAPGNLDDVVKDESKCYTSDYIRYIYAAYATIAGSAFTIDYKLGLRGEYNDRNFIIYDTGEEAPYQKFHLFPSVHLSKNLPNDQVVNASYSKRITRPLSYQMYDFPIFLDGNNIEQGDMYVKEEKGNSYELSYNKRFKKINLYAELYFRDVHDPIGRIWIYDTTSNVGVSQLVNYKREQSGGVEFSMNYTTTDWLKFDLRGNYGHHLIVNDFQDVPNRNESGVYGFNLMTNFYIKKKTRIQVNLGYQSGTATAQGIRDDSFHNSIGIRQTFLNNKISVNAGVWNLVNTARWKMVQITPDIKNVYEYKLSKPMVFFNISYRFNNYRPQKGVYFDESNYSSDQYE
jgi:outer membrane receptor protein involved in Fe transport